jgi:hypothetical protein
VSFNNNQQTPSRKKSIMIHRVKQSLRLQVALAALVLAAGIVAGFVLLRRPGEAPQRFVPGQRLVYQLEVLTASTSDFTGLTEGTAGDQATTTEAHTNVSGELVATVLHTRNDGALIAFELRRPTVQVAVNGDLALAQGEAIATDLARPMFAEVDARGRIVKVRFAGDVQPLAQAFARSLLAATQVVSPPDADARTWQAQEDDPNGTYTAAYATTSAGGGVLRVEKRRTGYMPKARKQLLRTFEPETTVHPAGQLTAEFDGNGGALQSLSGTELTTVEVAGRVVARSETTLRLRLLGRETAAAAEQKALRSQWKSAGPALALSAPGDTSASEDARQRAALGDATLQSLLTDLARLQADGDDKADDTPLYLKMKAIIHLQPAACAHLGRELAAVKADGPALGLLSSALSSVGHAEAQTALRTAIAARPNDWPALMLLVPALAMVESPTVESEQALRDLARSSTDEQIRSTAQLALGMMARSLAADEPERTRRILQDSLQELAAATTPEARRQQLLVLGNIGASETLGVITPYLRDEAAPVRSAAAAALRWLESSAVDELLVNALANDADTTVRLEAAQALGFRPMTSTILAAHKSALAGEASATVRLALLRNVAQAHRTFGEARTILADVAQTDSVAEVREEAGRLFAEVEGAR